MGAETPLKHDLSLQNQVQGVDKGSGGCATHSGERKCKNRGVQSRGTGPELQTRNLSLKDKSQNQFGAELWKVCASIYLLHFCSLFSVNTPSIDSHVWWGSSESLRWRWRLFPMQRVRVADEQQLGPTSGPRATTLFSQWGGWEEHKQTGSHFFFGSGAGWRERLTALEELKGEGDTHTHTRMYGMHKQTRADWGCRAGGLLAWVTLQSRINRLISILFFLFSVLGRGSWAHAG